MKLEEAFDHRKAKLTLKRDGKIFQVTATLRPILGPISKNPKEALTKKAWFTVLSQNFE